MSCLTIIDTTQSTATSTKSKTVNTIQFIPSTIKSETVNISGTQNSQQQHQPNQKRSIYRAHITVNSNSTKSKTVNITGTSQSTTSFKPKTVDITGTHYNQQQHQPKTQCHIFCALFIFRGHETWELVLIFPDDEQCDLFYSGPNLTQLAKPNAVSQT